MLLTVAYHLVLIALFSAVIVGVRFAKQGFVTAVFGGMILLAVAVIGVFGSQLPRSQQIELLLWTGFADVPLLLAGAAWVFFRQARWAAVGVTIIAALIVLAGVDALVIEPRWLEVTTRTISSSKIHKRVRVALVADIQTMAPGDYEEMVLRQVKAAQPDLILFSGDYLEARNLKDFLAEREQLNQIFKRVGLSAPLGMFAVQGNVDWVPGWIGVFDGLPVTAITATMRVDLGDIVLTNLSLDDSRRVALAVAGEDKYQIVVGHEPNFSLGEVQADLLLAGHTHGGQVQIPFYGPIIAHSAVPREWASGMTVLSPGKYLIVSRGIGMERLHNPQVRFFCRPEVEMIDLLPAP